MREQQLRAQVKRRSYPDVEQQLRAKLSQYPFLWSKPSL